MSIERQPARTDLGYVDGAWGDERSRIQTRLDLTVSGPRGVGGVARTDGGEGEPVVTLSIAADKPADYDGVAELELPRHTAERLRDSLDAMLSEC